MMPARFLSSRHVSGRLNCATARFPASQDRWSARAAVFYRSAPRELAWETNPSRNAAAILVVPWAVPFKMRFFDQHDDQMKNEK